MNLPVIHTSKLNPTPKKQVREAILKHGTVLPPRK